MVSTQQPPLPRSIKRIETGIRISWEDGHEAIYSDALLRRGCPCAGCRETPPRVVAEDDPLPILGDVPIRADNAELVGNYAVQFSWNDGHSTGIYSFKYLRELCPCPECEGTQPETSDQ